MWILNNFKQLFKSLLNEQQPWHQDQVLHSRLLGLTQCHDDSPEFCSLVHWHCGPSSSGLDIPVLHYVIKGEDRAMGRAFPSSTLEKVSELELVIPFLTWRSYLSTNWISRAGLGSAGRYYTLKCYSVETHFVFMISTIHREPGKWNSQSISKKHK